MKEDKGNQEKVWDEIASLWNEYKVKRVSEGYRKNLVKDFISEVKGNILDLGCGAGKNFYKIKGNLYGVDFSEKMLDLAEENAKKNEIDVKLIKADFWKLPFDDEFFDKIIFMASLHCVETKVNRKKSLKECHRILKNNGEMLITVWNKDNVRWRNKDKEILAGWNLGNKRVERYYYLYDENELINELGNVGFEIRKKYSNKDSRNLVLIVKKS